MLSIPQQASKSGIDSATIGAKEFTMTQRIAISLVILAVVVAAGCWAKNIFAQSVVKEPTSTATHGSTTQPASPLDFVVKDIDGKEVKLSDYRGKVVMIVNVASKCGFTRQYAGLEKLYKEYSDKGFVILGFPANNFGGQEPGSDSDIKTFCTSKFDVTFPMMSKISVKGDDQAPLYKFLTEKETAGDFKGDIGWNFTKFIVDRNGNLIGRFASATDPSDQKLVDLVKKALDAKEAK
jgi:glutathione peroxidase